MSENQIIIKLNSGLPEAEVAINKDGNIEKKTVSMDDLSASLSSFCIISSGLLPKGTRYFSGGPKNFVICVESAGRIRLFPTAEFSTHTYKLPFPNLLFFFKVQNSSVTGTRVFAIKGSIETGKEEMYRFPFSNTWPDGRLCWSSTVLPKIVYPMDIIQLLSLFYDSKYSAHLLDNSTVKKFTTPEKNTISAFKGLIDYLDGKAIFTEEALYPLKFDFNKIISIMEGRNGADY